LCLLEVNMISGNRLIACSLRSIASRLSVPDMVLKNSKRSLWGNLLADSRARCSVYWPPSTRAFTNHRSYWQPLVRGYQTPSTRTTGFARTVYDENDVCTHVFHIVCQVITSWFTLPDVNEVSIHTAGRMHTANPLR